jgi:hypothetical protein
MKSNKKLFSILSLLALLLALFTSQAFAASPTRVVRPARVNDVKVRSAQPATFRLRGSYTCDKVRVETAVSGKTITIRVQDVKVRYSGVACDSTHPKAFSRDVVVSPLVPGVYTVIVNPDTNGKGQKVIKGFIAPLYATATPAPSLPTP